MGINISAEHRSNYRNGDVSIRVKNSQVDENPQNKQINCNLALEFCTLIWYIVFFYCLHYLTINFLGILKICIVSKFNKPLVFFHG